MNSLDRQRRHPHGWFADLEVGRGPSGVHQLAPGKRPMRMDSIHHQRVRRQILIIDQTALGKGRQIAGPMKLHLLRAHDSPPALGLDPSHLGERGGPQVAHAIAVGHLEEAVACRHRTQLHRLEEHVVAYVSASYTTTSRLWAAMRLSRRFSGVSTMRP